MTLYEIDAGILELLENGFNLECVDTETGEIDEEKAKALLDSLNAERDKKIENIAVYIKNLSAEVAEIEAEEKALADRRKAKERKVESLKDYITQALLFCGARKWECARAAVTIRDSKAVEITNQGELDSAYIKVKTSFEPDKVAIKRAIESGADISGATLVTRQSLTVK